MFYFYLKPLLINSREITTIFETIKRHSKILGEIKKKRRTDGQKDVNLTKVLWTYFPYFTDYFMCLECFIEKFSKKKKK